MVWILVQLLPDADVRGWGRRLVFISSVLVTIAALIMRRKLDESPVFQEVKAERKATDAPVSAVLRHGRPAFLRVFFMMFGVSTQSYTYQVFVGSYLVSVLGTSSALVPQVLLVGSLFACVAAYTAGASADRFGRRPSYLLITGLRVLAPVPSFLLLSTKNTFAIYVVIVLGFVLAAEGAVGVQASYFPQMFGSRYRYAGLALGRESASVVGGGVAPLNCSALLTAFTNSWWPVAIYMMVTMAVSFLASWFSPETRDRDLTLVADVVPARG